MGTAVGVGVSMADPIVKVTELVGWFHLDRHEEGFLMPSAPKRFSMSLDELFPNEATVMDGRGPHGRWRITVEFTPEPE